MDLSRPRTAVTHGSIPALVALVAAITNPVAANDLVRLAADPAAGGSANMAAFGNGPLTALSANPALLATIGDGTSITTSALLVDSTFTSQLKERAEAKSGPGLVPVLAAKRAQWYGSAPWTGGQ